MKPGPEALGQRRVWTATAVVAALVLSAGVALRVIGWLEAPAGPWVDEAYALRAARAFNADSRAPIFGTTPLQPPEESFVNAWLSNPYLLVTSAVDRAAGGGMRSIRMLSVGPAVLLLFASAFLAAELLGGRQGPFLACLALLASSSWLLSTGRWGWIEVSTSLLLVLAAASALRAGRLGSNAWSVVGGVFLGLAQYGYVAAWLAAPAPVLLLLSAAARRARGVRHDGEIRRAVFFLAATAIVACPLAFHLVRHPERAIARPAEIGVWRGSLEGRAAAFAEGLTRNARLFVSGGDPNWRHGNPERPLLPPLTLAFSLAGGAAALARGGGARVSLLFALLLLSGGVLAYEPGGANAFRISPAAPFLLVLAGVGMAWLLELLGEKRRRAAAIVLSVCVALTAVGEVRAFSGWVAAPELLGWFGGPERDLADAIAASAVGAAPVVVDMKAVRNPYVTEVLLDPPAGGQAARPTSVRPFLPSGSSTGWWGETGGLWAVPRTQEAAAAAGALGGRQIAAGDPLGQSYPGWLLFRIPPAAHRQ